MYCVPSSPPWTRWARFLSLILWRKRNPPRGLYAVVMCLSRFRRFSRLSVGRFEFIEVNGFANARLRKEAARLFLVDSGEALSCFFENTKNGGESVFVLKVFQNHKKLFPLILVFAGENCPNLTANLIIERILGINNLPCKQI